KLCGFFAREVTADAAIDDRAPVLRNRGEVDPVREIAVAHFHPGAQCFHRPAPGVVHARVVAEDREHRDVGLRRDPFAHRVHAAAVLDAKRADLALHAADRLTDQPADLVRVRRLRVAPGADRPDRLVRNDDFLQLIGRQSGERAAHLLLDERLRFARVTLLERLTHAHDRRHPTGEDSLGLLVDDLVGLAEVLAAFGVAGDDVPAFQAREHRRSDLAGPRAFVLPVTVLRAELDRRVVAFDESLDCAQRSERRTYDRLDLVVIF